VCRTADAVADCCSGRRADCSAFGSARCCADYGPHARSYERTGGSGTYAASAASKNGSECAANSARC
jgi:hypothetical protein